MEEGFRLWANPSSPHAEGRKARAALEDARERVKRALWWDGELIFTSGASEALWIALNRSKASRRIVSAVEHDAVFRAAPDADILPVKPLSDAENPGEIDLSRLSDCADALIAIQHINSETGIGQSLEVIHPLVQQSGGTMLVDCSQSAARLAIPSCDMAVVSAHKFGGPIGIGALLVRDFNLLEPTGGHERGYRAGTENLPAALGMATALEAWKTQDRNPIYTAFEGTEQLRSRIAEAGGQVLSGGGKRSNFIHALAHPTISAQAQLIRLDTLGFAVSAGSACSSGTLKKSRVLDAFGVPDETAARTIRVSLGWNTTPEELERFSEAWASLC